MQKIDITLSFSDDIEAAPRNKVVLAWGNGGWRFMKRDEEGNWRSMINQHRNPPKLWALCPEEGLWKS